MALTLRPDQVTGVKWIKRGFSKHKGVLLGDRMGLGKTPQAIKILKEALKAGPVLIIVPAYIILNWLDEFELWGVRRTVCVIDSGKQILHDASIYIGSYNLTTGNIKNKNGKTVTGKVFKQLMKKKFSLLICDEAHYMKSWDSTRARRILGNGRTKSGGGYLGKRSLKILLLTGTPFLNRIGELYNLIIRIAPAALDSMSEFAFLQAFAGYHTETAYGWKHGGVNEKNLPYLKELLKDVLLARQNYAGLPPLQKIPIKLSIKDPKTKAAIKAENDFLLEHGIGPDDIDNLDKLKKLEAAKLAELRQKTALCKMPLFIDAFSDIQASANGPVVLFCYHRLVQAVIHDTLKKKFKELNIEIVNGGVSHRKRHGIVKDYQAGKFDVLLATIDSVREGIALTTGDTVAFVERVWTPASEEQAIARVRRPKKHGSKEARTVFAYFIEFDGGIDKYISQMLKGKARAIKQVLG